MIPFFTCDWNGDVCAILPAIVLVRHRCEDEECAETHAWSVSFAWLSLELVAGVQIGKL